MAKHTYLLTCSCIKHLRVRARCIWFYLINKTQRTGNNRWLFKIGVGKKHCVKSVRIRSYSGPYFTVSDWISLRNSLFLRIQSECWKIRTRITPNTCTFYAVKVIISILWWWWWIVFVVWLTDKRRLALFPAGTIVRDPHHRWMKLCSSDKHYTTAPVESAEAPVESAVESAESLPVESAEGTSFDKEVQCMEFWEPILSVVVMWECILLTNLKPKPSLF